ncbi:unnamed protein product [Mytilus coruscus]|uniref:Uncharacterized protein n=1 Tax=Mytilus coruscus TaxID=42192 RepID=A0A6J8ACR3_MYTCO|nr:unnamed protein product [Mytilus coruscus]
MMGASQAVNKLPKRKEEAINKKKRLFNRVVDEFENASTFFPNSMSDDTVGKHIGVITACLWYLDGSTAKIMERSAHLVDVKPLPESLLSLRFTAGWGLLKAHLENMALSMNSFATYLEQKNLDQQKRQKLNHPVREVADHTWIESHDSVDDVAIKYSFLDNTLTKLPYYSHLYFDESNPPDHESI